MHVVVGGGDQVYNDGFWKMKTFQDWLSISGDKVRMTRHLQNLSKCHSPSVLTLAYYIQVTKKLAIIRADKLLCVQERLQHPFTLEMEQSLSSWVLNHYRMHFTHKLIKQTFACIPQVSPLAYNSIPCMLLSQEHRYLAHCNHRSDLLRQHTDIGLKLTYTCTFSSWMMLPSYWGRVIVKEQNTTGARGLQNSCLVLQVNQKDDHDIFDGKLLSCNRCRCQWQY